MVGLKVCCWNIEHAERLLAATPTAATGERSARIRSTLTAIAPDVVCLVEGPAGAQRIAQLAETVLENGWVPVVLEAQSGAEADYHTSRTQWIWFLVRPELAGRCRLQPPAVWHAFTGQDRWQVHYWGELKPETHSHYRHPQVLVLDIGPGTEIELIGVHLKSKVNLKKLELDADNNVIGTYLTEALQARVKLATEALNVRRYIEAKFDQKPKPGLLVMGDANDGPGRDHFEAQYLFFDLVSNLQGDVMRAERYFNHALFDFPERLRWTARFADPIARLSAGNNPLLLDHILMSQALCRGELPLVAHAHSGQVEHEAFERANAGARSGRGSSDHRPVSLRLDPV